MQNQLLGSIPLLTDIIATNKAVQDFSLCQACCSTLVEVTGQKL